MSSGNDGGMSLAPENSGESEEPVVRLDDSDVTEEDLLFPDRLEERIRARQTAGEVNERAANSAFLAEMRHSFGYIGFSALRRVLQFFVFILDILTAFAGGGSKVMKAAKKGATSAKSVVVENNALAKNLAETYLRRVWRLLRGPVLLYRLERRAEGFHERTADFIDRVDLRGCLSSNPPVHAALVVGRFDKVEAYHRGKLVDGLRVKLLRREQGNLFELHCDDAHLPPLPPAEILQLLARHTEGTRFCSAEILAVLLRKGLSAEAAVAAAHDAATRIKKIAPRYRKLREENAKLRGLLNRH